MIKVTAGNNVKRETTIIDENTTLRACFEELGIDYSRGVTHLDGAPLNAGDLNKTFKQFGFAGDDEARSKCFLMNVVKADNA